MTTVWTPNCLFCWKARCMYAFSFSPLWLLWRPVCIGMHRLAQVAAACQACLVITKDYLSLTYCFRQQGVVCLDIRCQQQWPDNNDKKIRIWPMQTVMYASPLKSDRCIGICCTGLDLALSVIKFTHSLHIGVLILTFSHIRWVILSNLRDVMRSLTLGFGLLYWYKDICLNVSGNLLNKYSIITIYRSVTKLF